MGRSSTKKRVKRAAQGISCLLKGGNSPIPSGIIFFSVRWEEDKEIREDRTLSVTFKKTRPVENY